MPAEIAVATKGEIAWAHIEAALESGIPRGIVLMDAGYGVETQLRERLSARGLTYAAGVRSNTTVWWGEHQPAPTPQQTKGRPRTRLVRDKAHDPSACSNWRARCRRRAIARSPGAKAPTRR